MLSRNIKVLLGLSLSILVASTVNCTDYKNHPSNSTPNFVLILTDDRGNGDIESNGAIQFEKTKIEKIAQKARNDLGDSLTGYKGNHHREPGRN